MSKPLKIEKLPLEIFKLDQPPLETIVRALNSRLTENFSEVDVKVVDCPDLTEEPFNLAAKGICGNVSILDIGGPAFLLPLVQRDKIYDLRELPALIGEEELFLIGAGAGPWPRYGTNCEMICNTVISSEDICSQGTRIARIKGDEHKLDILPAEETRYCLLANICASRGEKGNVIKIHCKKRKGSVNFPSAIQNALKSDLPGLVIGLGGTFVILNGKAKQHIMPDFSETPLNSDTDVNNWLKFFEMPAPLTVVGTLVSRDPGLGLRDIHFHSFGKCEGGHYHYDTTPDEVEYLAYFSVGCNLYRVDRPSNNSKVGFD